MLNDWLKVEWKKQLALEDLRGDARGESKDTWKKCTNCGYSNHETKDCRRPKKSTVNVAAMSTSSDSCPTRKGSHTWKDRKTRKVNCTCLASCPEYINLSVADRAERLHSAGMC